MCGHNALGLRIPIGKLCFSSPKAKKIKTRSGIAFLPPLRVIGILSLFRFLSKVFSLLLCQRFQSFG